MNHIELFLKIVFYPIVAVLFILWFQINSKFVEELQYNKKPAIQEVPREQKPELHIPKLISSNAI